MHIKTYINKLTDCYWHHLDNFTQKVAKISGLHLGVLEAIETGLLWSPSGICGALIANPLLRLASLVPAIAVCLKFQSHVGLAKKTWVKRQIKQICLKSKSEENQKKLVYVIASYNLNHTDFFNFNTKLNIENLAKNYQIHFFEAKTPQQLERKISTLKDNDIDDVIVHAHGNVPLIYLAKNYPITSTSLGIFEILSRKLKGNSKISLISCLTARGLDNIALRISKCCSQATIFAPNNIYSVSEGFTIWEDSHCTFKSGNYITGLLSKREDTTTIYQNGQLLSET